MDLNAVGARGFVIRSAPSATIVWADGAGDVNGDGRTDLIVADRTTAYIVFGKASSTVVDLAALGSGGFRINGANATNVAGAGDVNGDGRADVIVGDMLFPAGFGTTAQAYVVFGKTSSGAVDVSALGTGGFRIDASGGEASGTVVGGAG